MKTQKSCWNCLKKARTCVHHIVPKALGGTSNPGNLAVLCYACHGKIHGSRISKTDMGLLTKKALAERKRLGLVFSGSIPYGLKMKDGRLLIDRKEIKTIKVAQDLKKEACRYDR